MKASKHSTLPAQAGRTRLMAAMAAPAAVMLGLHVLAHHFDVPGDSPLAWLGAACAALLMAGASALGQERVATNRPK